MCRKGGVPDMGSRVLRMLLWTAVIGMMTVIFAFSAQPGPESDKLTEAAAMPIAELIAAIRDGHDEAFILHIYNIAGTVIRKAAHVCEYALLGLLLRLLCGSHGWSQRWLPFVVGVAYAASDELHQAFVPGRLGAVTDVLIDSAGVFIGVFCIISLIDKIRRKNHVHDQ